MSADLPIVPMYGRGTAWELVRRLEEQIDSGRYPPGSRLPSYRRLAEEFDLTAGTVSYAMTILAEQGRVERRHGSGVYVRPFKTRDLLSQANSGLFALVVPEIESGLYLSLQAGMEAAARENREQLITMTTDNSTTQQADSILRLVDRGISGIAPVSCYEPAHAYQLRHLHRSGVPLVLLHRGVTDVSAPLINIPFHDVGQMAGSTLAELGHKRVAAFIGPRSETAKAYLDGFRLGLQKHKVMLSDENVFYTESMLISSDDYARYGEVVDRTLTNLVARPDSPTAAFVTFDRMAEMIYAVATRKGLHFPEDLSLVAFGESRRAGPILPCIATVAVDEYAAGRQAYDLLSAMHRGEHTLVSDEKFTMPISLDRGTTLGSPRRHTRKRQAHSQKKR